MSVEERRPPVDPRLWQHSRSARGYLVLTVSSALVTSAAVIVSAIMIGTVLSGVITDPQRRTIGSWSTELTVLAAAIAVRAAATWVQSRYGHRAALWTIADLKGQVLAAASEFDSRALAVRRDELTTVLTRALDSLRPYLTGYLPALVLSVTATPAAIVVLFCEDVTSGVIVTVTLPLIPIFMILIGLLTRGRAAARLHTMTRLSAQLLDLVSGLPTLRALGRERGPAARVRKLGEAHRESTMAALRLAFLSAMVLELLATLCVALVAVSIGLRLVYGDMALSAGLIALILAPEVYLPLRTLGAQFHAAEDGLAAADSAFAALAGPRLGGSTEASTSDPAVSAGADGPVIRLDGLSVPSRSGAAPHGLSLTARPGSVTVLTGPNGAGKSTALEAILGLTRPSAGVVMIDRVPLDERMLASWWARIAWLPQRPAMVAGTLRENLAIAAGRLPEDPRVVAAARATGFDRVLGERPAGWSTVVGAGGSGLSLGQRQRFAVTSALANPAPVLLLDEPTAHLDPASERRVLAAIRARACAGDTVVVVGHRHGVLDLADDLVVVHGERRVPESRDVSGAVR